MNHKPKLLLKQPINKLPQNKNKYFYRLSINIFCYSNIFALLCSSKRKTDKNNQ